MGETISLPLADTADPFAERLDADGQRLERGSLETLQLNLGKMCNLACHHCHVEAGPNRTEIMPRSVVDGIRDWIDREGAPAGVRCIDLTGGAPEMNPHFRDLVRELRARGQHVIDRTNLTILLEPGYEDLAGFLADQGVEMVASLPCYDAENVDKQRGKGVFDGSIRALRALNGVGYGIDPGLKLDLVYNPVGASLPPAQEKLEAAYKRELWDRFGIRFNALWTITNMPIRRFARALQRDGKYESYMSELIEGHNPANVPGVMCRSLVSVGWLGGIYDCDFNQMEQMPVHPQEGGPDDDEHAVEASAWKLWDFTADQLIGRKIRTGAHCFGCTAGAGSSCSGALG